MYFDTEQKVSGVHSCDLDIWVYAINAYGRGLTLI